jgi:hypothetical protein
MEQTYYAICCTCGWRGGKDLSECYCCLTNALGPISWLIEDWVRSLAAPLHLCFTKAPDGSQAYTVNILRFQEKGSQVSVPKCRQGLTFTQVVDRGFLFIRPHFLHNGLSVSPVKWRCLRRVLWPVRRPVTTLDWVLLKDSNLMLVPRQGPEINYRACLRVLPRSCQMAWCCLISQHLSLFLMSLLETPKAGSGPKKLWAEPPLVSLSAISLPRTPACPGTQKSLTNAEQRYHSTPPDIDVLEGMSF